MWCVCVCVGGVGGQTLRNVRTTVPRVCVCPYAGLVPGEGETKVAIKTLNETAGQASEEDFFKEAEIMQELDGPYPIVRLLGICTKARPYLMFFCFFLATCSKVSYRCIDLHS